MNDANEELDRVLGGEEGKSPIRFARPATEPRTEDEDAPQTSDEWRDVLIEYAPAPMVDAFRRAIEAEAAQGAAPLPVDDIAGDLWHQREGWHGERFVEQVVGEPGMYDDEADERPIAAPRAEGLDVERLADIVYAENASRPPSGRTPDESARWIVKRYARLSRPSDEGEGSARSRCKRFRHDEHCIDLHDPGPLETEDASWQP